MTIETTSPSISTCPRIEPSAATHCPSAIAAAAIRSSSDANRNHPPAQTSPALPREKAKVTRPSLPNFCAAFLTGLMRLMSKASFWGEKISARVAIRPRRIAPITSAAKPIVAVAA